MKKTSTSRAYLYACSQTLFLINPFNLSKMKKQLRFSIALLCCAFSFIAFAQQPTIVVTNAAGTSSAVYHVLKDAITNATAGSYLYLSGGAYTNSTTETIDKELHLIGAGYHPDATKATSPTVINNRIVFTTGAKGSTLEGLKLNEIQFMRSVEGITFKRDYIVLASYDYYQKNLNFYECILNSIGYSPQFPLENSTIKNCIFGSVLYCSQSTIENCVFLNAGGCFDKNTYKSNIFRWGSGNGVTFSQGSFFYNNIFDCNVSFSPSEVNIGNQPNIVLSTIFPFITPTGGYIFNFADDFHPTALSAAVHMGYNNTDCGIYGGLLPFKEKGIPSNPHIETKTISGQTDASGNLNVKVTVKAQSN